MKEVPKINTNVALCKCPSSKKVYGIRIEQRGNDWVRTWAFKIDEKKAKREGFNDTKVSGSLAPTPEYPGCPYCGSMSFAPCSCGKAFCAPAWEGKPMEMTCPWCGGTAMYYPAETTEIRGNGL
jgi:hypothetical protein